MKWFSDIFFEKPDKLPTVEELSEEIPAVSEYLDIIHLPDIFQYSNNDTLPVIDFKGKIIGIVSEYDIAQTLPEWSFVKDGYKYKIKVKDIMTRDVLTESINSTPEKLMENINKMHIRAVPLVKKDNVYTGLCVKRNNIINFLTRRVKPTTLGGFATPLGVYITDGRNQAGAGNFGLFLSGVFIALFFSVLTYGFFLTNIPILKTGAGDYFQILIFLLALRISPFSQIHASEHKTINTIEKGLPLEFEIVKMQSRVHRRCGTNFTVLIIGVLLILYLSQIALKIGLFAQFFVSLVGFLFLFSKWKQLGILFQRYLTTAEPNEKQLKAAIKVGEEIIEKHKNDINPKRPSFLEKIWSLGFFQILSGFFFVLYLLAFFNK